MSMRNIGLINVAVGNIKTISAEITIVIKAYL